MEMRLSASWDLLKATGKHWAADNAQRLAAALAYYAVLALPPTLIILLFIVSLFYDPHSASSQVSQELNNLLGQKGGQFMQTLMAKAPWPLASPLRPLSSPPPDFSWNCKVI